ncbi:MAG: ATP-binding protein [Bacteroidota bacterium]
MEEADIDILKRALERERRARKEAERILEKKSGELYLISEELKEANRKLEGTLLQKTNELQGVFDNLVDAYVLMDVKGNILAMNQSAIELFGFQDGSDGVNVVDLIYKEDFEYAMQSFNELVQKGSFSDYQARVYTRKKGVRNVHINASVISNDSGEPVAAQGIVRDITEALENEEERKALLLDLERTNKDLTDFAHVVSHDLKSPLRSMDTLINWLKEDFNENFDPKASETLELLLDKVDKMDRLIEGVLQYSSIDRSEMSTERIDTVALVNEITHTLEVPKHIDIEVGDLPVVEANKYRLLQLFQNLLSNAILNMDKKQGDILVTGIERQADYYFKVEDNGKGIPKSYQQKIFNIFESLNDDEQSTGIGLAIVKKVIEFYKGTIWVESEVSKGTVIHFTIGKEKHGRA